MKQKIGIISKRSGMGRYYQQQLTELFGDSADIYAYNLEEKTILDMQPCKLYLISSTSYDLIYDSWAKPFLPPEAKLVHSRITFSKEAVNLLRTYPEGTKAMLVNQSQHMALESIAQLYHLGINNIEFFPCYPELREVPPVELAFAPGEAELAPPSVKQVVDLGCRKLTANTVCEIALKLDNPFFLESTKFQEYAATLASVDYSLQKMSFANITTENKLEMILNSLEQGIVCIDEKDTVTLISRAARELLDLHRADVLGKPITEILPFLPFDELLCAGKPGVPKLIRVRGLNLGVTVTQLRIRDQYLGAFALLQRFEEGENRQNMLRLQMISKDHRAKYTFDDIIGDSPAIFKAREIAARMAQNDAYIMLEGESGTGKELFAQAIHNASPRRNGPFIAVNCAALPETLLESELFGYAEGSFTGAKKGGKPGLFEYAHHGTLFLDEIETMSPGLQSKLLRALQEKEIVRIGSSEPIAVDVRVLSSTNEDLGPRVQNGSFRRDLYYRLNVIPVHIPSLWERQEDIFRLLTHFQRLMGIRFTLTDRAEDALRQHPWKGNVRELRNCVEYLRYMGLSQVDYEDLPAQFLGEAPFVAAHPGHALLPREQMVLRVLGEFTEQGKGLGRQGIVRACAARGTNLTEHEVRLILDALHQRGYLQVAMGRSGTSLSAQGRQIYQELKGLAAAVRT